MSNFDQVQRSLSEGVEPALICSTCPWDRFCITPPSMTKDEIDKEMADAKTRLEDSVDKDKDADKGDMVGGLLNTVFTSLMYAGKDTQATVCPVLVVRMRGSEGRKIVDNVRAQMQAWDDDAVTI